jgi:hypothetical protein
VNATYTVNISVTNTGDESSKTITSDYFGSTRDGITTISSNSNSSFCYRKYESSTLSFLRQYTSTTTSIYNGGTPTSSSLSANYSFDLLSNNGTVKTYKHYDTSTSGAGNYSVFTMENDFVTEEKYYTTGDV